MTVLLGNLRRAVSTLQGQSAQSRLRQKLLAWREWASRRRHLARSVASRLQGRYLGGVWQSWREFVQYAKLSRSQGMAAIGHFTAKTSKQVPVAALHPHMAKLCASLHRRPQQCLGSPFSLLLVVHWTISDGLHEGILIWIPLCGVNNGRRLLHMMH